MGNRVTIVLRLGIPHRLLFFGAIKIGAVVCAGQYASPAK